MTQDQYMQLRTFAIATGNTDRFVILKEDEDGRYIDYAFQEGAPHDNRCLSWYDSFQPKALTRNDHDHDTWKKTSMHEVGKIYELGMFSCGLQDDDPDSDTHCSPGHPCKKCKDGWAAYWTPEEPVKCACWYLTPVKDIDNYLMTPSQALEFAQIVQNEILSK